MNDHIAYSGATYPISARKHWNSKTQFTGVEPVTEEVDDKRIADIGSLDREATGAYRTVKETGDSIEYAAAEFPFPLDKEYVRESDGQLYLLNLIRLEELSFDFSIKTEGGV